METAKCSGWPLTHVAINYCPLLSSVLSKGRDADKKYHLSAWKEGGDCDNNQLTWVTKWIYCWCCVSAIRYNIGMQIVHCWKTLKYPGYFFCLSSWCITLVVGVLCLDKCSSVLINNWPVLHAVKFEWGLMGCITSSYSLCYIKQLYCNGTSKQYFAQCFPRVISSYFSLDFNLGKICFCKNSSATWEPCRNQLIWLSVLLMASSHDRMKMI